MIRIALRALFIAMCLLFLVFSVSAPRVSAAPEFRVAYVDIQEALAQSVAGKKAQKEYQNEVKKAQQEIDRKKEEFQNRREAFDKQKDSLNEQALASKQEELISLEKDLKRSFQDSQAKLRRQNAKVVAELVGKLREVVDEVGKKEGYTVILEKGSDAVLYADNGIDITQMVVEKYDAGAK